MKIVVLDDNYPAPDNLYADVFAHVRVKAYRDWHPDLVVGAYWDKPGPDYRYEGVDVRRVGSMDGLVALVAAERPDVLLVHFATFPLIRRLLLKTDLPVVVWVHGFEALGWYRRLFNFTDPLHFARYIKGNLIQLFHFRRVIRASNAHGRIHFVFVSDWMRRIAETDCLASIENCSIIPNPIDDRFFGYRPKTAADRCRWLMIRPFSSKKYATDLATEALKIVGKRSYFGELQITVVGSGAASSELARHFAAAPNVSIREGFLTHDEVRAMHADHGVFLCPTRQDAQGVSMCEAMSSGLVPVSSSNSAIPEFVHNGQSGLLTDNRPQSIADALEALYRDPDQFLRMSAAAARSIREKAGIDRTISRELGLIERAAGQVPPPTE